jgi:hypothetical protein
MAGHIYNLFGPVVIEPLPLPNIVNLRCGVGFLIVFFLPLWYKIAILNCSCNQSMEKEE